MARRSARHLTLASPLNAERIASCEVFLSDLADVLARARTVKTRSSVAQRHPNPNRKGRINQFWYQAGEDIVSLKAPEPTYLIVRLDSADGRKRSAVFKKSLPVALREKDLHSPTTVAAGVMACLESFDAADLSTHSLTETITLDIAASLPLEDDQLLFLQASTPYHRASIHLSTPNSKHVGAPAALISAVDEELGHVLVIRDVNERSSHVPADSLHASEAWLLTTDSAFLRIRDIDPMERMAHIARGARFDLEPFRERIAEKT